MYQLQTDGDTQWVDYDCLTDHLDLVILYEKQRKAALHRPITKHPLPPADKIDIDEDS